MGMFHVWRSNLTPVEVNWGSNTEDVAKEHSKDSSLSSNLSGSWMVTNEYGEGLVEIEEQIMAQQGIETVNGQSNPPTASTVVASHGVSKNTAYMTSNPNKKSKVASRNNKKVDVVSTDRGCYWLIEEPS
ncbi:hypothetical protein V6N13_130685 [Hibiscus sabdariffa]|uniref:Uncharacterized protein n=1 Tax=Hibiscus sabdariffa TaxID=183260 RepID=A0ABR2BNG0_9ROSI